MAIELTPNRERKMPRWVIISAVIIAIGCLVFIGTYLYFYFINKKMASNINELNDLIIPLEEAIKQKEDQLSAYQQKINDFNILLLKHKKIENVFTFLEKYAIPSIWFNGFEMDQDREENIESFDRVVLKGKSLSFLTIEQQINIFSEQEEVKKVTLDDISITEEGEVEFSLSIIFNPIIFNYNFYKNG